MRVLAAGRGALRLIAMFLAVAAVSPGCRVPNARPGDDAHSSGYVDVGEGVRLYYEVRGEGKDTVIVPFLSLMMPEFERIAKDRVVIAYDMRGRGRSTAVEETQKLGLQFDIDDIERVREHFRISKTAVLGASYLGAVAALYAAKYPHHVSAIVQISPIGPVDIPVSQGGLRAGVDTTQEKLLQQFQQTEGPKKDPRKYCELFWAAYGGAYAGSSESIARVASRLKETCALPNETPAVFLRVLSVVMAHADQRDWTADARAVSAPSLIVFGDSDRVAPQAGARQWAGLERNARMQMIEGGGHLLWLERPELVYGTIDGFLRSVDTGR